MFSEIKFTFFYSNLLYYKSSSHQKMMDFYYSLMHWLAS